MQRVQTSIGFLSKTSQTNTSCWSKDHGKRNVLCAMSNPRHFLTCPIYSNVHRFKAHRRSHDLAQHAAVSNPSSSEDGRRSVTGMDPEHTAANNSSDQLKKHTRENMETEPIILGSGSSDFHEEEFGNRKKAIAQGRKTRGGPQLHSHVVGCEEHDCENEDNERGQDSVVQSAVMLRFGAEVPTLAAAGKCGRTVQFPIPKDWSDPEVSAQRTEAMQK